MTDHAVMAAALVGAALLAAPAWSPKRVRRRPVLALPPMVRRAVIPAAGVCAAAVLLGLPWWAVPILAAAAAAVSVRSARRVRPLGAAEMRELAGVLDLFAACLDAGLAAATALAACLAQADSGRRSIAALARTAALLQLGGEPRAAWRQAAAVSELAALAAAAERSAAGGLHLASVARHCAVELRAACRQAAMGRAARAGVAMTAPLALCFLPAFLCLGLAPTVIGLVGSLHLW